MWYLPESVDDLDLINAVYARAQATMHTKDLIVDDHAQGKEVEHVCKVMPDIGIAIFAIALGVEAV